MTDVPQKVGSAAVEVVPDAREFKKKLQAELADVVVDIKARLMTEIVDAQLDEVTREREARIVANADTGEASARLDEAARDRKTTIWATVRMQGLGALGAGGGSLAALLGGASLPLLGGLGALGLGAAGVGGVAAYEANQYAKAEQAAAKTGKGYAPLPPQFQDLHTAITGLSGAMGTLAEKSGVLPLMTLAIKTLTDVLGPFTPLIAATTSALSGVLGQFDKFAKTKEFRQDIQDMIKAIPGAVKVMGDITRVIWDLFMDLVRAAPPVEAAIHGIFDFLGRVPKTVIEPLAGALTGLMFGGPVGALVGGFAGLGLALVTTQGSAKGAKNELVQLGDQVRTKVQPIIDALKHVWKDDLVPAFDHARPTLEDIGKRLANVAEIVGTKILPKLLDFTGWVVKTLMPVIAPAFDQLAKTVQALAESLDAVLTAAGKVGGAIGSIPGISGHGGSISKTLGGAVLNGLPGVGSLNTLLGGAKHLFGGAIGGNLDPYIPRWVGENGPEWFTPTGPGQLTTNQQVRSGGLPGGRMHPADIDALAMKIGAAIRGGTQNLIDNSLAWGN